MMKKIIFIFLFLLFVFIPKLTKADLCCTYYTNPCSTGAFCVTGTYSSCIAWGGSSFNDCPCSIYCCPGCGCCPCPGDPPTCNCGGSRTETQYRCSNTKCGASIQKRTRTCSWGCSWEKECECVNGEWDCGRCIPGEKTCDEWSSPQNIETCKNWQKCGSTEWSDTQSSCQCAGECLEAPENLKIFDGLGEVSPDRVKLPIKLTWNNVAGAAAYYYEISEVGSFTQRFENGYSNYGKTFGGNFLTARLTTSSPAKRIELNYGYIEEGTEPGLYNSEYNFLGYGWQFTNVDASIIYGAVKGLETIANSSINYFAQIQDYIKKGTYVIQCEKAWMEIVPSIEGIPYTEDWAINYCGAVYGGSGEFVKFWTVEELETLKEPYYKALEDVVAIESFVPAPPPSEPIPSGPFSSEPVSTWKGFVVKPEITFPPCLIKSNTAYIWKVRACCSLNKETCGKESTEQFTTNAAPEPVSPYDKDWNGTSSPDTVPLNVTLKWCESNFKYEWYEKPLSYKLLFYELIKKDGEFEEACHPKLKTNAKCDPFLLLPRPEAGILYPSPEFPNEQYGYFIKNYAYAWETAACKDISANECTDFSQRWRFLVGEFRLEPPDLISPPNDPLGEKPVGLPVLLDWEEKFGTRSFWYKVSGVGQASTTQSNVVFDYPKLSLDTMYSWTVKPCWDLGARECEDVWATTSYFKTTGRPPKPESLKAMGLTDIFIPVNLEWENVPGAKSFIFKISGNGLNLEKPVKEAKITLDYPDLHQEANYSWQVRTCARENGDVCGVWSQIKTFRTFRLGTPSNPSPSNGQEIFTYEMPRAFSWNPVSGAKYYKYILNYTSKSPEETGNCPIGKIIEKIISIPLDFVSLNCLGDYQWQVQACLDKDCNEAGNFSPVWSFILRQKEAPGKGGLVPCGRAYDNPRTPWNERETCQLKHLFFMLVDILDFLFWRVGLIILVLLVMFTAIIYYFSMGAQVTVINVKAIWGAAGIGYGIIFLAWTIVNLILILLGYKIEFFGRWWEIKF